VEAAIRASRFTHANHGPGLIGVQLAPAHPAAAAADLGEIFAHFWVHSINIDGL
jgi:hypothetical protein